MKHSLPISVEIGFQSPSLAGDVIVDLSILNANRAALIASHSATNLLPPIFSANGMITEALSVPQSGRQHGKRGGFIAMLGAFRLALNDKAARFVSQDYCGFRLIAMLTARTCAALEHPFKVGINQPKDAGFRLSKRRDCDGAGMNASALFVRRYSLPSMAASFIGKCSARILACDLKRDGAGTLVDEFCAKGSGASSAADTNAPVRLLAPWRHRRLQPHVFQQSSFSCALILALMLLLAAPVSAQPVRDVPDVLSYGTAVINPALAGWKAYRSADPYCQLSKLAITEAIGNGAVLILKHFIHSDRPCPGCVNDGMPSGHSMNGAIGAFSNGGWGFALTLPTPFLRVGANRHTTTQAAVGTLIGLGADAFGQYVLKCGS